MKRQVVYRLGPQKSFENLRLVVYFTVNDPPWTTRKSGWTVLTGAAGHVAAKSIGQED
jgi:hypothetical protein